MKILLATLCGFVVATIGQPMLFAQSGDALEYTHGLTRFGGPGLSGQIVEIAPGVSSYSDSSGRRGTITDMGPGWQHYSFTDPGKPPC